MARMTRMQRLGEHRLPACPFRLPAEILLRSASCRTLQAGSLRSPDVYFGAREATVVNK